MPGYDAVGGARQRHRDVPNWGVIQCAANVC